MLWKEDGETRAGGLPKRPVGDLDHDGRWAGWSKERRSLEFVAFALSAVAKVCRLQLIHVKSLPAPRTFPFPRVGIGAAGMFYPSYGFFDPPTRGLPVPVPVKTRTLSVGTGFWRVRVRVALKYPRFTRDNP